MLNIFCSQIMGTNIAIFYVQISLLLLDTTQNLLLSEYSVKIFNTENIIFSLEDFDGDEKDDLEIINTAAQNTDLDEKLQTFHKYVRTMKVTKSLRKTLYFEEKNFITYAPDLEISYPENRFGVATQRKSFKILGRNTKKRTTLRRKIKNRLLPRMLFRDFLKNKFGIEKRELTTIKGMENIDEYDYLEKQYHDYIGQSKRNKTIYKYTDEGKPEENVKDIIKKITDLKAPKNCTNVSGIGVQAVECVVKKLKSEQLDKKEALNKISVIMLIWFCIYVVIAMSLWCTKGWCCCCFRCTVCLPNETVREVQKYVAANPPGVYINSDGEEEHYRASLREAELYEKLKRCIADF